MAIGEILSVTIICVGACYKVVEASSCDDCPFLWRDGGIYDTCEHPDQDQVMAICGRENRLNGRNFAWVKVNAPVAETLTEKSCVI